MKKKKLILFIIFVLMLVYSFSLFNILNFKGEVIDKVSNTKTFHAISYKTYMLKVKTWYGEKEFLVNKEDIFNKIEVGKTYRFKRKFSSNYVKVKF